METFATPANFLSQNRDRSPVVRVFTLEKQAQDDLSVALAVGGREAGRRKGGRVRKKRATERRASIHRLFLFSGNLLPARI